MRHVLIAIACTVTACNSRTQPIAVQSQSDRQGQPLVYHGITSTEWIKRLGDFHEETHTEAINALSEMGPGVIPQLVLAMKGNDARVAASAAMSLGYMGPNAKSAIPAIREYAAKLPAHEGDTLNGREHAAYCIAQIDGTIRPRFRVSDDDAADLITKHSDPYFRTAMMKMQPLGKIYTQDNKKLIAAIEKSRSDPDGWVNKVAESIKLPEVWPPQKKKK